MGFIFKNVAFLCCSFDWRLGYICLNLEINKHLLLSAILFDHFGEINKHVKCNICCKMSLFLNNENKRHFYLEMSHIIQLTLIHMILNKL